MLTILQRVVASAATVIAVSIVIATPAQANPVDCEKYLKSKGYAVGKVEMSACYIARTGRPEHQKRCVQILFAEDVKTEHAARACQLAGEK